VSDAKAKGIGTAHEDGKNVIGVRAMENCRGFSKQIIPELVAGYLWHHLIGSIGETPKIGPERERFANSFR
jgi:hypothetical protein